MFALVADWEQLEKAFFKVDVFKVMWPDIITVALKNTLLYTACAFGFGLVVGLLLALMRLSPVGPYRWIATGIIEFFRGVPALVVFIAFYYGIPIAFVGYEVPGGILGNVTISLGLVGRRLHGRDHPGRHPGRAQGPDRSRPVARHVSGPSHGLDRHPAGVPDHPAAARPTS